MIQIEELEMRLRDLINVPQRHAEFRSDQHKFDQLCSALDVINILSIIERQLELVTQALQEFIVAETRRISGDVLN